MHHPVAYIRSIHRLLRPALEVRIGFEERISSIYPHRLAAVTGEGNQAGPFWRLCDKAVPLVTPSAEAEWCVITIHLRIT